MVELVDTGDSKSPAGNSLPVQVRPPVPFQAAAMKLIMDRVVPVSLCDKDSDINKAISIKDERGSQVLRC